MIEGREKEKESEKKSGKEDLSRTAIDILDRAFRSHQSRVELDKPSAQNRFSHRAIRYPSFQTK
jgi:hypothetical protein